MNIDTPNKTSHVNSSNYGSLDVAWLMSFPNSGTSYTISLIHQYTNTSTATNYGKEYSETTDSIPVFPNMQAYGPYLNHPAWKKPPKYILTKTHCAMSTFVNWISKMDSATMFDTTCSSGSRMAIFNGTAHRLPASYDPSIVKQAVHLIRNPFNNVVARFHLKVRIWKRSHHHEDLVGSNIFNSSKEGFKAYCQLRDKPFSDLHWNSTQIFQGLSHGSRKKLLRSLRKIPCYEQFFHYIRWHNFAVDMLQDKGIPFMTLFYEDYALKFDDTVNGLHDFLVLEPAMGATPPDFITGKQYLDYIEPNAMKAAKKLMKKLSSKDLQHLLQRYLQ